MELQFQSKEIPCLQHVSSQVLNQEQTMEVRLDDSMPAIGRVLGAWGQVVLRGKEWRSGAVQVSGGVTVWVLYLPEDGGNCQSVEAWVPFNWKVDLPAGTRDGTVIANGLLRSVDGRGISGKKLMIRANVGLQLQILAPDRVQVYEPAELPEHVCLRRQDLAFQVPAEAGEKPFQLDELLQMSGGATKPEKIMYYCLQPEVIDKKVMADKVVFRGMGLLHMAYLGEDGKIHTFDQEIPFAQYGELSGQYGEDAAAGICMAVTALELHWKEDGNIQLTGGLTVQYVIYENTRTELITDAYSTQMEVQTRMEPVRLPVVEEMQAKTLPCQLRLQAPGITSLDVQFLPEHPCRTRMEDGICLEPAGRFQLLGYNQEGEPEILGGDWSGEPVTFAKEGRLEVTAAPTGTPRFTAEGENALVQAELLTDAVTFGQRDLQTLAGLELSERQPEQDRPSLILRRPGEESLWEMAKAVGSTEKAIMEINGLDGEPDGNRMLIIPILS